MSKTKSSVFLTLGLVLVLVIISTVLFTQQSWFAFTEPHITVEVPFTYQLPIGGCGGDVNGINTCWAMGVTSITIPSYDEENLLGVGLEINYIPVGQVYPSEEVDFLWDSPCLTISNPTEKILCMRDDRFAEERIFASAPYTNFIEVKERWDGTPLDLSAGTHTLTGNYGTRFFIDQINDVFVYNGEKIIVTPDTKLVLYIAVDCNNNDDCSSNEICTINNQCISDVEDVLEDDIEDEVVNDSNGNDGIDEPDVRQTGIPNIVWIIGGIFLVLIIAIFMFNKGGKK